jgi:hypothetical protein
LGSRVYEVSNSISACAGCFSSGSISLTSSRAGMMRTYVPDEKSRTTGQPLKAMLRADKEAGVITLDSETSLAGVPAEAWDYKLGNRSALEWILD